MNTARSGNGYGSHVSYGGQHNVLFKQSWLGNQLVTQKLYPLSSNIFKVYKHCVLQIYHPKFTYKTWTKMPINTNAATYLGSWTRNEFQATRPTDGRAGMMSTKTLVRHANKNHWYESIVHCNFGMQYAHTSITHTLRAWHVARWSNPNKIGHKHRVIFSKNSYAREKIQSVVGYTH